MSNQRTNRNPDDLVPEEDLKKLREAWGMEMFKMADAGGEVDLDDWNRLSPQTNMIAMRDDWGIEEAFDLTTAPYWIRPYEEQRYDPIPVHSTEQLAELREIHRAPMTYQDLNGELGSARGKLHAQAIMDAGADPTAVFTSAGGTDLHLCGLNNHACTDPYAITPVELAEVLLANGVDPNIRDHRGRTPLHQCDRQEVAQLLIDHGSDVNAIDHAGRTPLHTVYSPGVSQMLIDSGADVFIKDEDGYTALDLCTQEVQANDEESKQTYQIVAAATSKALLQREFTNWEAPRPASQAANDPQQEQHQAQRKQRRM